MSHLCCHNGILVAVNTKDNGSKWSEIFLHIMSFYDPMGYFYGTMISIFRQPNLLYGFAELICNISDCRSGNRLLLLPERSRGEVGSYLENFVPENDLGMLCYHVNRNRNRRFSNILLIDQHLISSLLLLFNCKQKLQKQGEM